MNPFFNYLVTNLQYSHSDVIGYVTYYIFGIFLIYIIYDYKNDVCVVLLFMFGPRVWEMTKFIKSEKVHISLNTTPFHKLGKRKFHNIIHRTPKYYTL